MRQRLVPGGRRYKRPRWRWDWAGIALVVVAWLVFWFYVCTLGAAPGR